MAALAIILFALPVLVVLGAGILFMLQRFGRDAVAGRQPVGRVFGRRWQER